MITALANRNQPTDAPRAVSELAARFRPGATLAAVWAHPDVVEWRRDAETEPIVESQYDL